MGMLTTTTKVTRWECDTCGKIEVLLDDQRSIIGWDLYNGKATCMLCSLALTMKNRVGKKYRHNRASVLFVYIVNAYISSNGQQQPEVIWDLIITDLVDNTRINIEMTAHDFIKKYGGFITTWEEVNEIPDLV